MASRRADGQVVCTRMDDAEPKGGAVWLCTVGLSGGGGGGDGRLHSLGVPP